MTRIAITMAALLLPGAAVAHPEHFSGGSFGLGHSLTDPFHLMLTGAAAVLYFAIRQLALRRRVARCPRSRPLRPERSFPS